MEEVDKAIGVETTEVIRNAIDGMTEALKQKVETLSIMTLP